VWFGSVAVTCQTCNPEAAGSTPSWSTVGKLFTHNVPLFTKQYNLVPYSQRAVTLFGWEGNRGPGGK